MTAPWLKEVLVRISDLGKMPAFHNSYGCPAVSDGQQGFMARFLESLPDGMPEPVIRPTGGLLAARFDGPNGWLEALAGDEGLMVHHAGESARWWPEIALIVSKFMGA